MANPGEMKGIPFPPTWREAPIGGVAYKPSTLLKTGTWRLGLKPVVDEEKCTGCGTCHLFCPDGAIRVMEGKAVIDYAYCKGCGICSEECPTGAIEMVKE